MTYPCEQFTNGAPQCCSPAQGEALQINFDLLWATFGKPGAGGCPACFRALQDFWCSFTCSANQSSFVTQHGLRVEPDSTGTLYTVLGVSLAIDAGYACAMFAQCAATTKARLLDMPCEGFLGFQGHTSAIPHGIDISFDYTTGVPDALLRPVPSCCSFAEDPARPEAGNTSCPCATCSASCANGNCPYGARGSAAAAAAAAAALAAPLTGPLFGLQVWIVGALYISIAGLGVLWLAADAWWGRRKAAAAARSSALPALGVRAPRTSVGGGADPATPLLLDSDTSRAV
jgi:hypothetical protein